MGAESAFGPTEKFSVTSRRMTCVLAKACQICSRSLIRAEIRSTNESISEMRDTAIFASSVRDRMLRPCARSFLSETINPVASSKSFFLSNRSAAKSSALFRTNFTMLERYPGSPPIPSAEGASGIGVLVNVPYRRDSQGGDAGIVIRCFFDVNHNDPQTS